MSDSPASAEASPERTLFSSRREYSEALARLIALAQRELRIFDLEASSLDLDAPQTADRLREFLLRGRGNRLYIVVHDTTHIRKHCPRLLGLLRQFSDRMFIHQTQGEATSVQDCLVLADKLHFARRPVYAQPRGTFVANDDEESQGVMLRFSEIWDSSFPAVSATTTGL